MKTGALGNWKLLLTVLLALPIVLKPILGAQQALTSAASEGGEKLAKDEIIMLMVQVGRMPIAEQNRKMDALWENPGSSRSPRADFFSAPDLHTWAATKRRRTSGMPLRMDGASIKIFRMLTRGIASHWTIR